MTPSFHQLCVALCHVAGTAVPDLGPDVPQEMAIAVTVNEIEVVVSHHPSDGPTDALLAVAFGPLPPENALATCRALMDINGLMLWSRACSFGRDPGSGEIVLQYVYPLRNASAMDLYARIRELVDIAQSWRVHRFLCPSGLSPLASLIAASELE